ncbi:hypothetical protein BDF19DRAFT_464106 [Syncephalis fuscata]|nr:hypothetical protein BDF19DRAFT_464106 [Syncephalis fuscata]
MNTGLRRVLSIVTPLSGRAGQMARPMTTQTTRTNQPNNRNNNYARRDQNSKALTTKMRLFRFCLPRPLKNPGEVEQVAEHFRKYGRLIMYRMSRCPDTNASYNTGFIEYDKDATLDQLIEEPNQKIEGLDMDVYIMNPKHTVQFQNRQQQIIAALKI